MIQKLLLILPTTTYSASAFMHAASQLDIEVVVASERRQALEAVAPGKTLALDFFDLDKAVGQIEEFAREQPLQAILGVDDHTAVLAALASEALRLPHNPPQAVQAANNKYLMRRILAAANIPSPAFTLLALEDDPQHLSGQVNYPCVLKPLFLAASRGVIRADSPESFIAAFERIAALLSQPKTARRGGPAAQHLLVEDFIPGTEVALEGLLSSGQLKLLALFDKPDLLEGPFFAETLYITPSRLPHDLQESIKARTQEAARALGLKDGPVHAELRFNDTGIWIVEIAARLIGGLCARILRFGTGVSLEELILRHAVGHSVAALEVQEEAAGVMMLPVPQKGMLRQVWGLDAARLIPHIEDIVLTIPLEQKVEPLPEGDRYLGFIFARGPSPARVEAALRQAYNQLDVVITREDE
jgi:biotin carboxylase